MRVEENTPGAVPRKLTKGKNEGSTVYELHYNALSDVHLMGGKLVESEHITGLTAEIELKDFRSGETYTAALPAVIGLTSSVSMALITLLQGITGVKDESPKQEKTKIGVSEDGVKISSPDTEIETKPNK
jgi:hypothetical protein